MLEAQEYTQAGHPIEVPPERVLRSPGFSVPYPEIRNAELIDPGCRAAMEVSWCREMFPERPIEVFHLKDVFIIDEGLVLDRDLRPIRNASPDYSPEQLSRAASIVKQKLLAKEVPYYPGLGIMAKRLAANNYGHFLVEMVSIAELGRKLYPTGEVKYLIHQGEGPMLDVALRSFRLLGHPLRELVVTGYGEPVHFDDLIVVRGLTELGRYMSPIALEPLAVMAERVPRGRDKRVFVRRIPGWERGRVLTNEAELGHRLEALGYRSIEPGSMTLEEQISVFRGAEQVVGIMGAAMTNIVFCDPGTKVTMLAGSGFPDVFFWFIAQHRRLHYTELRCAQQPQEGRPSTASDFRIEEADIAWLENQVLQASPEAAVERLTPRSRVLACLATGQKLVRAAGEWIGMPGSGDRIEAVRIDSQTAGLAVSYRGVLDGNWVTAWAQDGDLLGSPGVGVPLYGIGVRLEGQLASQWECVCTATFTDGSRAFQTSPNDVCTSPRGAPLEAFRLLLRPTFVFEPLSSAA